MFVNKGKIYHVNNAVIIQVLYSQVIILLNYLLCYLNYLKSLILFKDLHDIFDFTDDISLNNLYTIFQTMQDDFALRILKRKLLLYIIK